jgi:hypothetical protein
MSIGYRGDDLTWLREAKRAVKAPMNHSRPLLGAVILDRHQATTRLTDSIAVCLYDAPKRQVARCPGHSSVLEVSKTLAGRIATRQPGYGARRRRGVRRVLRCKQSV